MSMSVAIETQGLTGPNPPLNEIVLGLYYIDAANDYSTAQWFLLDAATPSQTWQFDPGDATSGTVFYLGMLVDSSGNTTTIEPAALSGTSLLVGSGVAEAFTVVIVPIQIDWSEVTQAAVTVNGVAYTLTSALPQFATVPSAPYMYSAVYTLADGGTYTVPTAPSSSAILLLPPLPPAQPVTFSVIPADFQDLPISSIALTITAPGTGPIATAFTASSNAPFTTPVYETFTAGSWTLDYAYQYTVTFSNNQPAYQSPQFTNVSSTSVTITEAGVREFALANDLSSIITVVTLNYVVNGQTQSAALPVTLYAGPNGYDGSEPFSYWLSFAIAGTASGASAGQNGAYVAIGPPNPPAYTFVQNPLQSKSVTVTATGLTGKSSVQLTPASSETGNLGDSAAMQWAINGMAPADPVTLTPAIPSYTYTFEAADPEFAALNYPGTLSYQGNSTPFNNATTVATSADVSSSALPFSIQIDPTQVNWTLATQVAVTLYSDASPSQTQTFIFTPQSGYQYFTYTYAASGGQSTFGYKAVYTLAGGGQSTASADQQAGTMFMLPPTGTNA